MCELLNWVNCLTEWMVWLSERFKLSKFVQLCEWFNWVNELTEWMVYWVNGWTEWMGELTEWTSQLTGWQGEKGERWTWWSLVKKTNKLVKYRSERDCDFCFTHLLTYSLTYSINNQISQSSNLIKERLMERWKEGGIVVRDEWKELDSGRVRKREREILMNGWQ